MNKTIAKGLANAIWSTLTGYYPNNMVELSQYCSYYEVRFFAEAKEGILYEVTNKVVCKELENVLMHNNVFNEDGDWCLHIEVNFEDEE